MEYLLLGQLLVRHDGTTADLGGPLQRTLLALLLVEAGHMVPMERIVDALWDDEPPSDPAASVQTYVYRLRRALGDDAAAVERVARGYRLAVSSDALDTTHFERHAAAARRALDTGDAAAALDATGSALALWRGHVPLADCGDRPFLTQARARWTEQRLACEEDRAAALVALDRHDEAIAELEALTTRHPFRERPWALLMTALQAAGRPADALDRYQRVRALWDEELGLEPGSALRELQARILRGDAPSAAHVERSGQLPRPPASAPHVPLVGRARELSALLAAADAAAVGRAPRFALVVGEPGIGKTRLVTELAGALEGRVRVVVGRCHDDPDTPALWPWREVLAAADASTEGVGPPTRLTSGDSAFALFDEVLRRVVRAAADKPLALVLDDVHWADAATLRLLAFLAVELRAAPVLVVATSRPGHDERLGRVAAVLARTQGFVRIELGPLDLAGTASLVGSVAGPSGADPERPDDVADLHARAGGNPFFVLELARLRAEGSLRNDALPAGVRDVVRLRLADLGPDARETVATAAVAGDTVRPALVLRAAASPPDAGADALDRAVALGLLRATGDHELGFAHALVRDAVLADLPDLHRRRIHARLAAALPPGLSRAQHLLEGRPFTDAHEAVEAAAEAGDALAAELAHEAAAQWYSRALAAVDDDATLDPSGARRAALASRAGAAWSSAGHQPAALAAFSQAIDLAVRAGDLDAAAAAAAGLGRTGGFWLWTPYGTVPTDLLRMLSRVLDALGPAPSAARARVLGTLASGSHYAADRSVAGDLSAQAVAIARAVQDRAVLVEALAQRLLATWGPADHATQLADADELVAASDDGPLAPWRLLGLMRRAVLRVEAFDLSGADADLRAAWELTERRRLPLLQHQIVQMQAARAATAGELEVAERLLERAAEISDRTQLYLDDVTGVLTSTFVRYEQGRTAELLPALQATTRDGVTVAESVPLLAALVLVESGRRAEAAALVDAHRLGAPLPYQWDWIAVQCWTAVVVCELGDGRTAGQVLERLRPHLHLLAVHGGIGAMGPVALYAGRCALVAGRADEAASLLRRAADLSREHGLRPALARALLWGATAVSATDPATSQDLAAEALAIARDVGMRRVARSAERVLGARG